MVFNFVLTTISISYTHESRPITKPLPDQILDRVPYQRWALHGSEILLSAQTLTAALVIIFHRHRFIVLRRVVLIIGTLYLYRAITMWVTALPVADPSYHCAPKFEGGSLTFMELTKRVFTIITGMWTYLVRLVNCAQLINLKFQDLASLSTAITFTAAITSTPATR